MANLFELFATLGLDTAAFDAGIEQADGAGQGLAARMEGHMKTIGSSLTGLAASGTESLHRLAASGQSCAAGLQSSLGGAWRAITAQVQGAIAQVERFLKLRGEQHITLRVTADKASLPGFATGLDYVPYNDFPARLHEGEAVLTRLEAQTWRAEQAFPAAIAPDAAALASAVSDALDGVSVMLDGDKVGELVAPAVNRQLGRDMKARRYSG